jgi:hypothetical protein
MTTYFHTAWIDSVTQFKAEHMNEPLSDLDAELYAVSGEVQGLLSDVTALDGTLTAVSGELAAHLAGGEGSTPYDIGLYYSGEIPAGMILLRFPLPRAVDFDFGGGDSQAVAGVGATGSPVFSIKKDGSEVGTITFSGAAGTFSGEASFTAGEVLTVVAPASADATLAGIGFALSGTR